MKTIIAIKSGKSTSDMQLFDCHEVSISGNSFKTPETVEIGRVSVMGTTKKLWEKQIPIALDRKFKVGVGIGINLIIL